MCDAIDQEDEVGKKISAILQKPYTCVIEKEDDGGYSVKVVEFSGCFAQGSPMIEAAYNLGRAAEA